MFRATPIEGDFAFGHGVAIIEEFTDLGIDLEIGRDMGDGSSELGKTRGRDSSGNFLEKGGAAEGRMELWF